MEYLRLAHIGHAPNKSWQAKTPDKEQEAIHKGREVVAGQEERFLRDAVGLAIMLLSLFFALLVY